MSRIRKDTETPAEYPAKPATPAWQPAPHTPPTEAERDGVRELIAATAAKLGAEPKAERRTPLSSQPKRCPKCETGNFVHMGVRYCLAGYLGRH